MIRTLTTPAGVCTPRRRGVVARILAWLELATQRRRLAELDERMLSDIGITREAALAEARRPIWDLPRQAARG